MKRYLIFILPLLLMLSCEDDTSDPDSYEYEETSSEVLTLEEQETLFIENTNGNIEIVGSDTATNFYLQITRRVSSYRSSTNARDHIDDISITYPSDEEALGIKVDHPDNPDLDFEVDLAVIAPIIFDYHTSLGNGNIDLDVICRNLNIILGNGNCAANVILLNNCSVNTEAGNGNIAFTIPSVTNAEVMATIGVGNITHSGLDFNNLETTGNSLKGTLGNGEGQLNVILGNGNIDLSGY